MLYEQNGGSSFDKDFRYFFNNLGSLHKSFFKIYVWAFGD